MSVDGDLRIPEVGLVLAIADPARDLDAIRSALEACSDWEAAFRAAARHNLLSRLAVLAHREKDLLHGLPPEVVTRLGRLRDEALYRDRLQVLALAQVLEGLRERGISPMLLKGQGLAERLYDDPAERISADIDVLVPPSAVDESVAVVEALGYKALLPQVFRENHFHICCFATGRTRARLVEVHWDVTHPGSLPRFPVTRWWDEAVPARVRAGAVLLPPPVDELAYLCFHTFQRGTVTLRDLSEIARYVEVSGLAGEMERLMEQAGREGVTEFVTRGFSLASSLWDLPLPELPRSATRSARRWLARNLFAPGTIARWGLGTWWPFCLIRLWSLIPRRSLGFLDLVRSATRSMAVPGQEKRARREPLMLVKKTASLTLALLLCFLPLNVFPRGIRSG